MRRWDPDRGRNLDGFVRLVARRRVARILGQQRGNPWASVPVDPQDLEDDPDAFGFRWELDVGAPVVDTIPDRWIDSSSVTIDAQWESPPCEIGP